MPDQIIVRPAQLDDAHAMSELVCKVLYASNLADYGLHNVQRVASHFTPDGVSAMLAKRDAVFVADKAGQIVGTASIDLDQDAQLAEVKTFFVDADLQRQGIGARLFEHIQRTAQGVNITRMTVRSSLAATQFYENQGFVAIRDHWNGDERTIEMRN